MITIRLYAFFFGLTTLSSTVYGQSPSMLKLASGENDVGQHVEIGSITKADSSKKILELLNQSSTNVESTGINGYDFVNCTNSTNCGLMIRTAPKQTTAATQPALRIQREASYSGGKSGATVDSVWMLTFTSPDGSYYEWPFLSEMYNQTGGKLGNGAQNVAAGATAIKRFKKGYDYGKDEIGPTWGSNFVCKDETGINSPKWSCIAQELDLYVRSGAGLDDNQVRVIQQLRAGGGGSGDHVGLGILFGVDPGMVLDTGIKFAGGSGTGTYGKGIDFTTTNSGFIDSAIAFSSKNQDKITWNDTRGSGLGVYNGSTAGFSIFAANDNKRYFDNYSNTSDNFRGSSGDLRFQISAESVTSYKPFKLKSYTVNGLPSCSREYQDSMVVVTDAASPTYRGILAGGGFERTPAFCDGTRWTAH